MAARELPWEASLAWVPNYASVEEHADFARAKFEEDVSEGLMAKMSMGEFQGEHTAIAALAIIVEDEELDKKRIIHDATHGVRVNHRIKCRDKLRSPGAREKKHLLREHEEEGETAFSVVGDIAKAHRRYKHAAKEHGYLACQVDTKEQVPGDPASQTVYVNLVGTFGLSRASYWWTRIAACGLRPTYHLLGPDFPLDLLLYADDLEAMGNGPRGRRGTFSGDNSCNRKLDVAMENAGSIGKKKGLSLSSFEKRKRKLDELEQKKALEEESAKKQKKAVELVESFVKNVPGQTKKADFIECLQIQRTSDSAQELQKKMGLALGRAIEHGEEQAKLRHFTLAKQRTTKPEVPKVKARPQVPTVLLEKMEKTSKKDDGGKKKDEGGKPTSSAAGPFWGRRGKTQPPEETPGKEWVERVYEEEWKAGRTKQSDEEYLSCKYHPLSPEWQEKVQKTLWNLAHRGFRVNQDGDQSPCQPYPWQLRSHREWTELNEDLQNRFGIRLIWRAQEKLRKFYPLRNIVIEKNKNERDEYSKFFPAISFVDYGAISSQSRNQNRKSADEKRKNPDLLPEIEPLAEEQEEESVAYAALLSAAKPGSEAVNLEGDEKKPGSKEKSSGKGHWDPRKDEKQEKQQDKDEQKVRQPARHDGEFAGNLKTCIAFGHPVGQETDTTHAKLAIGIGMSSSPARRSTTPDTTIEPPEVLSRNNVARSPTIDQPDITSRGF
ncbi:hypothetical protein AK812_SmicGene26070 [Symbiodinium microadriaticum]|uniref:Uncharacterized protein n=1 Tax=Symbiodinium microadriaticum TaxID=2951 RepID=A0A1Q9DAI7_SYMMI|nr:hypothetical protein AK812_SmicGene26070 [Symbiodinium microadriaticum]